MFQKVAVVKKVADRIWIAKIHAHPDARIRESPAVVIRNIYGIAKKRLIHRPAQIIEQQEMQLMNVEGVKFGGAVFYDPVFDRSLLGNDVWEAGFGIEHLGRLAVYGEIELGGACRISRIYELFGEIQSSRAHWSDAAEPWQSRRRKP